MILGKTLRVQLDVLADPVKCIASKGDFLLLSPPVHGVRSSSFRELFYPIKLAEICQESREEKESEVEKESELGKESEVTFSAEMNFYIQATI